MTAAKLLPLVHEGGALDPVCGMTVNPATAKFRADHDGHTYHFCSAGCQAKFTANPAKYLAGEREPMGHGHVHGHQGKSKDLPLRRDLSRRGQAEDVEYTCPMHPEVRQMGPGSCPICGMALEPAVITVEEPENEELTDM